MTTVAGNVWELSIRELINRRIVTFRHLRNSMALQLEISLDGNTANGFGAATWGSRGTKRRAYFNTLLFDPEDLRGMFNSIRLRKRTRAYFMLGASLGPILAISNPSDYIKAWDSDQRSGNKTKKRHFFPWVRAQAGYELGNFSYLDTHTPPFDLDFLQVFDTFCQITVIIIAKIDSRFKKMIGVVTKELDDLVKNAVTKELRLIDPLDMASPENEINTDWETSSVYK
ncbi:hypothetical protein BX661DRAFT_188233 [Kickxella alabastrina]|uniref:uncharacterized protein n=1 Tax=Kickxella alabastrina TaxID=61397 RepID=UPI00221F6083|nr:uncharacterized protein BX661DRAFT_188233 [Kickxella alabastrina]KAI7821653.1 hypothetical protein BX661DRAFT_188233 [Kickxella alabastrina]